MGTETNQAISPYNNDQPDSKNYHQVLFKPSVSVQTRELNELQTILQKQIERFGDSIHKKGTIISGCSFQFYNKYPYAKILDNETDGTTVIPALYYGKFAKNSSNLQAFIVNYQDGFESADPDLKTLYFDYINGGDDGITNAFSSGETITIFDSNNSLYSVSVNNGGLGFTNTDSVIITSAIAVNVSSGSFSNGDHLTIPDTGANLEIVTVDELTLANSSQVLLYVKPRNADLANGDANSVIWTLVQDADVVDPANTVTGVIENIFGSGASANIVTLATGKVANVNMLTLGSDYIYAPSVTVWSANNSSGISSLDLTAKNYYGKVQISSVANSIGNGAAFGVSDGIIYQKGQFINVNEQTVIVDKYTSSPNNVAVGFDTVEEIVDSNIDTSLLDNAIGSNNETAPGADRLKLTPTLTVQSNLATLSTNSEFFILVEWNEGKPYKQNQVTQYSVIGEEMANRQYDSTGNFVLDTYQVTTNSPSNTSLEAKYYTAVVDPGQAYISGFKTQTKRNYRINVTKGTDTKVSNNNISLNFGNYTRVKEVGGTFLISTGDVIDLYDTAKEFVSNTELIEAANTDAVGTKIGEARARSLVLENGTAGEANTIYRMYLFDIEMNPGKTFSEVRSIHYAGTNEGVADTVLETDPTTSASVAKVEGTKNNRLIFKAGVESLKNSNATNYIYRTVDQTTEFVNNGTLIKSVASDPNEFFPYSGTLTDAQMKELHIVPTGNNLQAYTNSSGTVAPNNSSNTLVGTSTDFVGDLEVGDYIYIYESAVNNSIRRVTSIINTTSLTLDDVPGYTNASGSPYYRIYPKHIPIPFGTRTGLSANVDVNQNILTLDLGFTLEGTANIDTSSIVNIQRQNVTSTSKTATRNRYIKITVANNAGGNTGPWCLGVSDVFRLNAVYIADTVNVNTNSQEISGECYIDNNQNANYNDLSWLYLDPLTRYNVTDSDHLLVEFDYYVRSGSGYFDTVSYLNTANAEQIFALDSTNVASLSTSAVSWEVPEVYTTKDEYYDLLNCFDFRPAVSNTVAPNTAVANAPVNPPSTKSFGNTSDPSNDLKFPFPDGIMTSQIEQYLGRIDNAMIAGRDGNIFVAKGTPDADPRKRFEPNQPKDALKLQVIHVPPYPVVPKFMSETVAEQLSTGIANEKRLNLRVDAHTVEPLLSSEEIKLSQPVAYNMEAIGNLERRIRDLEYYVSLSQLETSITNKQIPSSVDSTLNRFKFGFIADDFSTDLYSDIDNPQYAAYKEIQGDFTYGQYMSPLVSEANNNQGDTLTKSVFSNSKITKKETYRLLPPVYPWLVEHYTDNVDYTDKLLISQPFATEYADSCVVGTKTGTNTHSYYTVTSGFPPIRTDYVQLGIDPGTATLYFYNYGGADKIEVFQSNNLVATTANGSATLTNLSAADKRFISTNAIAKTFYLNSDGGGIIDTTKDYVRDGSTDFVSYLGKLTWEHDPVSGTDEGNSVKYFNSFRVGEGQSNTSYSVVVTKGNNSSYYRYLLKYPNSQTRALLVNPCKPPRYGARTGSMRVISHAQWAAGARGHFTLMKAGYNTIIVSVRGLKPNTAHNFYLDGELNTQDVRPRGKKRGAQLKSNRKGQLDFYFHIDETYISKVKYPSGRYKFYHHPHKKNKKTLFGSDGFTLFEVKGYNSSAQRKVARRLPSKLLK